MILHLHIKIVNENISSVQIFSITFQIFYKFKYGVPHISIYFLSPISKYFLKFKYFL
jgi:hypothetical protein